MAKFDLKKAILENKATFFSSLTEGQFSWFTQDTDRQIGSEEENTLRAVYMHDNKGNKWVEKRYEGYGEFGGKDYYELLDQMNGGEGSRQAGIDLAFNTAKVNAGEVLFPALVEDPDFNYKTHDFTEEAESDPNQSWYQEPEDEDEYIMGDDEDDEYLDESKIEEGLTPLQQHVYDFESEVSGEDFAEDEKENIMNLKTVSDVKKYYADYRGWMDDNSLREMLMDLLVDLSSKFPTLKEDMKKPPLNTQETANVAKRFADYMSRFGEKYTVNMDYLEPSSFELEVDGEEAGSYYIDSEGNIINAAETPHKVYANMRTLEEGDTEFQRVAKGKKNKVAKNKGEEDVYGAGVKKGEEIEKKKMKVSELKAQIKEMVLAEMNLNISDETPENEEDFLAEIEAMLAEADEEVDAETADAEIETPEGTEDIEVTDTTTTAEVDPNVKSVQDALTQAQAAAEQLGDKKLMDQIGNTITFFTRTHVVEKPGLAEVSIEETLLLQKRAGIITESQYKSKLAENK
jgi:hypothetical protein